MDIDSNQGRATGERDQYLKLLAEEYRTLSTTGNLTDRHTYTALQWGTAIVAVIASGVLTQWGKHDGLIEATFLVVIPVLVGLGMLYWIGELARMKRVYDFICIVEEKAELALQIGKPDQTTGWYAQFEERWRMESRQRVETKLQLVLPRKETIIVDAEAAPIQFERWLRTIRNEEATRNLSWVFMFRLTVFPIAIVGSWGTGMVYLLAHENAQRHPIFGFAATVVGGVFGIVVIWLAYELATDLNDSASKQELPSWRAKLRHLVHKMLKLPEWA